MAAIAKMVSLAASSVAPRKPAMASAHSKDSIVVASSKEKVVASDAEKVLFEYFGKDSLVIPGGVFITAVILVSGLFSLQSNNKAQQQMFMRMRVGAQGVTVMAMMVSLAVQERQKALGLIN